MGSMVSVIVITRDRPFLLGHCLERVFAQTYPDKEVIVVDSSTDDQSERLLLHYSSVHCIRLKGERQNMPRARNIGLEAASGEIIAFIDDDSMVQVGWLEALAGVYRDETVGAAGGRVISMPEPYCDQSRGQPRLQITPAGQVIARDVGVICDGAIDIDHLIGCNMSFRRRVLEQIGGFDVNYTGTNLREETDLCLRVKRAGWRIIFEPSISVVHFSARSLQPYFLERPDIQFSNGRNSAYFVVKHFGFAPRAFVCQAIDVGRCCGRAMYFAGLFGAGVGAHLLGRVVGIYEGLRRRESREGHIFLNQRPIMRPSEASKKVDPLAASLEETCRLMMQLGCEEI